MVEMIGRIDWGNRREWRLKMRLGNLMSKGRMKKRNKEERGKRWNKKEKESWRDNKVINKLNKLKKG